MAERRGSGSATRALLSPAFHGWSLMIGTPPFSTRSPSQARIAGSTVSEPTTATATTRIVPVANDVEGRCPGEVHPRHRDHHREAGDHHRAARGRRRRRQRRRFAAPRFALLALAAQVEHRVVDSHREADQQDHLVDRAVHRREWLIGPIRPIVAITAVSASSSGTPAATRAPNAISRISSVIGSEVNSACLKSSLIGSFDLLVDARVAGLARP